MNNVKTFIPGPYPRLIESESPGAYHKDLYFYKLLKPCTPKNEELLP